MMRACRSEIVWFLSDIEAELLTRPPLARIFDLRLARAHGFEVLQAKDAEIIADFERRADNYREEATRGKQTSPERPQAGRNAAPKRDRGAASKRASGGTERPPGLYDEGRRGGRGGVD